jgi:HEAT repeat protein
MLLAAWRRWRLARQLRSPDPSLRQQAVRLVAEGDSPTRAQQLLPLLADPIEAVRRTAADVLLQLDREAVGPLLTALAGPNQEIARPAAELLGWLGDARAVEPLLHAVKFGEHSVRRAAVRALEGIGQPAVAALRRALSDAYPYVRNEAAGILARLGASGEPS